MGKLRNIFIFGILILLGSTVGGRAALGQVRLVFDSASLDFGDVSLTGAKTLTIEVWDTSSVDIEIDRFGLTGVDPGDFSVTSDSTPQFVVLPDSGNNIKIAVTFSPLANGARSGFLEVESSDGNVYIPLTGIGGVRSSLAWSLSTIDFGVIAPGAEIDTTIELYSTGIDSATIDVLEIASADASFDARTVSGIQPPFILGPGDSIAVDVSFQGLLPIEEKNAQLLVLGATLNQAECDLKGIVEYGTFAVLPPIVDFGTMYAGQVRDTTVMLANTGEVPISINSIADLGIDPSGDDFTLLNPLDSLILVPPGGEIPLTIRANPGLNTSHAALLFAISQSASPNYEPANLTVSVVRPSLTDPPNQTLSFFCALSAPSQLAVPISDTGSGSIVITNFVSSDANVTLLTNPASPDTLAPGEVQSVSIQFDPAKVTGDTLVVEGLGGEQVMIADTISLQPKVSFATASVSPLGPQDSDKGNFDVSTATSLAPFDIDTIIVHISVGNTNVAIIDTSEIKLPASIANAAITSIQQEPGGYAVTIASSLPITLDADGELLAVGFSRFVSIADSSDIFVAIETPEKTGCLDWALDTSAIQGAAACGSTILQNAMTGTPIILSAALQENPVTDIDADVTIYSSIAVSQARYSLINAIGASVRNGTLDLAAGPNVLAFSLSRLPDGAYILRISTTDGHSTGLRLLKLN